MRKGDKEERKGGGGICGYFLPTTFHSVISAVMDDGWSLPE
jgi:hypothetical protein